ncbi:breast carcinoma amplified sequence 2 [Gaertneriomyces semiglobifer]|nr:breast carcinoma amplified sequence 2 [Gaertneriomyces semiglobifer]
MTTTDTRRATASDEDAILDSLPYIDGDYGPELMTRADELIAEEVKVMKATGMQPEISLPPEVSLFESIDTVRFRLEPPKDTTSEDDWEAATRNSEAQLEHQYNRLINLELVNKFGNNAWRLHNYQLEHGVKAVAKELDWEKEEITEINKQRKIEQIRYGKTLQDLAYKWSTLLGQTIQAEVATQGLEQEVAVLRLQNRERGSAGDNIEQSDPMAM